MEILEINYINFRNLSDRNIQFSPRFNLFYGKNGQGKTSILEAIYFVATGKSFRTAKNSELIKYNKEKMGCFISYRDNISEKTLTVKIDSRKKEYSYNGKKVSFDDFYGRLNVVSFIPEDINLIVGSPAVRRSFFDGEISQSNSEYFKNLKDYTKLLKLRNKFLKERDYKNPLFSIYQEEFIKIGAKILKTRVDYVKNISIILNLNYRKLFDDKKELSLKYNSSLGELKNKSLEEIEELLKEKIKGSINQELRYGFSLVGPQRDDFLFLLNEKEAKSYSSQGEKKSIIFSLKLSEIDMILKEKRENPIFLIDDISSYFDSIRKENIVKYLKKREIQVFISSTGELDINSKNFYINKGDIDGRDKQC
ncbi:MAG: DNA replication and repair protein RecF [Cetobacterium sp.]|uniref:DNA replication and repair protein RecF n=1 Tax=Cetobacterium ceti TaxID=180163 RepID=A0A1T4PKC4_9FUSO|nr:DNA replication and repair protein RecF [Cetobacterium ceti]MCJ8341605.1 DNA replication and repair protein RecF [Cetobacterium sp.]SJZ92010.1 DNA replication and repair protein RecF [Cetobacterium ceti]